MRNCSLPMGAAHQFNIKCVLAPTGLACTCVRVYVCVYMCVCVCVCVCMRVCAQGLTMAANEPCWPLFVCAFVDACVNACVSTQGLTMAATEPCWPLSPVATEPCWPLSPAGLPSGPWGCLTGIGCLGCRKMNLVDHNMVCTNGFWRADSHEGQFVLRNKPLACAPPWWPVQPGRLAIDPCIKPGP